jgi:hypothetical protein
VTGIQHVLAVGPSVYYSLLAAAVFAPLALAVLTDSMRVRAIALVITAAAMAFVMANAVD